MNPTRLPALLLALAAASSPGCGRTYLDLAAESSDAQPGADPPDAAALPGPDAGPPPVPARTTLTPPPGPFNGQLDVLLATDKPADLHLTTDGSDPRSSPTATIGPAPLTRTLTATTTLTFFSRTPEGADEDQRSVMYVRAGAARGTVSGVVVVGASAVGLRVGIQADLSVVSVGTAAQEGELPFSIEGLSHGAHRLIPFADSNGDGFYVPLLDLAGPTLGFELDFDDPFRASLEGVRLYLGASQPGLCTIRGQVRFTAPVPGQTLAVAALDPAALQAGVDPRALLTAFGQGWRATTNAQDTVYEYAIVDLTPGPYLPVPALTGVSGGVQLNLLANVSGATDCPAGGTVTADFDYGQVELLGTVSYTPASPAAFAYGAVVARNISFSGGGITAQIVLMPAFLLTDGATLSGSFGAKALRDNGRFDLRAFTNLDPGGGDPFTAALGWALNPFSPLPAQGTVVATPPSATTTLQAP